MTKRTMTDNIIDFFRPTADDLPEAPLPSLSARPSPVDSGIATKGVNLADHRKVVMTMGPGRSGKSTLLRWMIERAMNRDGKSLVLATVDPDRPVLRSYFEDAMSPVEDEDGAAWLEKLFEALIRQPHTAAIDFGADMSLRGVAKSMPGLLGSMIEVGLHPVVFYTLTPRELDLTVLDKMERAGVQPEAIALVFNLGTIEVGSNIDAEFAAIKRHGVFREAVARGALVIEMPRLQANAASAVERRLASKLGFFEAASADSPLEPWNVSRVQSWLREMEMAFSPVGSWLP